MHRKIVTALAASAVVCATVTGGAYVTFSSWNTNSVMFFINPQNADVTSNAAEAALVGAMQQWNGAGTPFRYQYGGRVSDTTTGYDERNVIIFRNTTNGSTIASTYWWTSNADGKLVDADIVFWDGAYQLFTGTEGCSNGIYIEDVGAHELGHALGLRHSEDPEATMYTYYNMCTQLERTLNADDIAGIRSLYGTSSNPPPANTAPSVSISSPQANASFVQGTSVTFSGSANDTQDGDLTSAIQWQSSRDGALGTGTISRNTLSVGTHTITASATDSGNLTGSAFVTITVTATPPVGGGPTLNTRGYKVKTASRVDLTWSGSSATSVDVYRNGSRLRTTANDGLDTDSITKRGGTFTYKICNAGTSTCSNTSSVTF